MRLSVDTGGTFTDLVVEDDDGRVALFKRPTTPWDPVLGILDVLDVAAEARGVSRQELLDGAETFIHATTHSLNALLTGSAARTAFLTTRGHPDVLLLREGGREHFNARGPYPDPLVPRSLTFEIGGRVSYNGAELEPFDQPAATEVTSLLRELGVEAVAVCFLWSIANPAHELACANVLDRTLPDVPYSLSHQLNPSLREYRRAAATAIDASLKPLMHQYLGSLSSRLRDDGFAGRLLMVTSAGTLLDVGELALAPIHSIKSGPAMAPVAGRAVADELGFRASVVTDTGGTSYDVSTVIDGRLPWTRETWLGRPYHSHISGFPSVDVRSYGAGGGSIAWVDRGGVLHVGPQSAGADPGPVSYGRGGLHPTFTDAAVTLRYIDPDDFLGGTIKLDASAARLALEREIGARLGVDPAEAAAAIVEVTTEQMARSIEETILRSGLDPQEALLVAGGGAAGLNAVGVARRVGIREVVVPGVSAALSAAGALLSEIGKDFVRTYPVRVSAFDMPGVVRIVDELQRQAREFLASVTADGWSCGVDLFCEGHYARQVWEIEIGLTTVSDVADVERLVQSFHERHAELYAVSDPDADIEFLSWRARAWAKRTTARTLTSLGMTAADRSVREPGPARERPVYFYNHGWLSAPVVKLEQMSPDDTVEGPAIVTSAVTTTVVDPSAVARVLPGSGLLIRVPISK